MPRIHMSLLALGSLMTTLALPAAAGADDTGARLLLKGHIGLNTTMTLGASVAGLSAGTQSFKTDGSRGFEVELTGRPIPYLAMGITTGMVFAGDSSMSLPALDLNAVIKLILPLGRLDNRHLVEFYAGVSGGLSLGLSGDLMGRGLNLKNMQVPLSIRTGWNVNPHGGMLLNVHRNLALFMELGYSIHSTPYGNNSLGTNITVDVAWKEANVRAGVGFNF